MTPEQEQAIRARHVWLDTVRTMDSDVPRCSCGEPWPCDTAVVLAALDEARAKGTALSAYCEHLAERDAARADAEALAVRFSTMSLAWHDQFHDDRRGSYEACKHVPCVSDRAALAAHEAQKEGAK